MRTVELAITASFLRKSSLVIAILVKTENTRVAVAVGNEDGAVRGRYRSGKAPLIGGLKSSFRRSSDLQHYCAVDLHLYKQPVLCGRAFLDGRVKELLSVLFGMNQRMHFGIGVCYRLDQDSFAVIDEHSGGALRADVHIAGVVLRNSAVCPSTASA